VGILFNDTALEVAFLQQGYVVVDLPGMDIPLQLQAIFDKWCASQLSEDKGFYYSLMNAPDFNEAVRDAVHQVMFPVYQTYFNNYEAICESFLAKRSGESEEFFLHQDWSIVDERQSFSLTYWCPLEDTSPENGGFFVIPGSHHFLQNYRSGSLHTARIQGLTSLRHTLTSLVVRKGQLLLFHPATFHGSHPNPGTKHRIIAAGNIKPLHTPFCYVHNEDGCISQYHLRADAFLKELPILSSGNAPAEFIEKKTIQYVHDIIDADALIRYIDAKS
jgi:hypothetical protein